MSPSPLLPPQDGDQRCSAGIRSHSFGARSVLGQRDLNTQPDRSAGTVSACCCNISNELACSQTSVPSMVPLIVKALVLLCMIRDAQAHGVVVIVCCFYMLGLWPRVYGYRSLSHGTSALHCTVQACFPDWIPEVACATGTRDMPLHVSGLAAVFLLLERIPDQQTCAAGQSLTQVACILTRHSDVNGRSTDPNKQLNPCGISEHKMNAGAHHLTSSIFASFQSQSGSRGSKETWNPGQESAWLQPTFQDDQVSM